MNKVVCIVYTNHRGEKGERRIEPIRLRFGESLWHPEAQWLLDAWDLEKNEMRTFAMKNIELWRVP
jgi:predicted DNA-binding transcriptional regulator YafY